MPTKNYAVFGIVFGMPGAEEGAIPLVQEYVPKSAPKKRFDRKWKLPGGRREDYDKTPRATLARELREELNITVKVGHELFRKELNGHTFIVFAASYVGGEPENGDEIEFSTSATLEEIDEMIEDGEILSNHASALKSL